MFNTDVTRKRYNADKQLSKNLEEKDKIEREFVKKREKVKIYLNIKYKFKFQGLLLKKLFFLFTHVLL